MWIDQIVDIIIKLKTELEAREKFAAELKEAEDSLNEINTDIASAQHINESYDHSMAKLKKLEKSNADKRQELKDLQSKIDSFDPMLVWLFFAKSYERERIFIFLKKIYNTRETNIFTRAYILF